MEAGPEVIGPINLGNTEKFSIRALAELILELTGSRSKIVHRPLPEDDPRKRRPDISEAESVQFTYKNRSPMQASRGNGVDL
jgi:UDP-glucuronate decarboxylase